MSADENTNSAHSKSTSVQLEPLYYRLVVGLLIVTLIALIVFRPLSGGLLAKYGIFNTDYFIIVMGFYLSQSWRSVPAGYAAGISTFGIPSKEVNAGWFFVPLFFCTFGMFPMREEQEQFPADPEMINKGPDTGPLRAGELRPIRTNTGPGDPNSDDILSARAFPEWTFSVRWATRSKSFFEIDTRLKGDTWDEKHATVRRTMRDTGEGLLARESAKRSPVKNIDELAEIGELLNASLQTAFDKFDIDIIEVRLQAPDFGTGINHALAKVIEERANAKMVTIAAEAEKGRQILISEGAKTATINASEAQAIATANAGKGLRVKAIALGMSGSDLYTTDILPSVFGDKVVIFGPNGLQEMATGIKAVTDAMNTPEKK